MSEIFLRNSTLTDVDRKLRLIDLVAVPWEEEGDVLVHGEVWREVFTRGAFDGLVESTGRVPVRVNREHVIGNTVGNVVHFDPQADVGLLARVKVAKTLLGDETLALAEEDMISASVGYRIGSPADVTTNRRTKVRRVTKAFLDHLGMVEAPAYAGARVLAVRAEQGLTVVDTPPPPTPVLDELMNDEVLMWAASRRTRD